MTRNALQFVHSARPPDADLRVFDSLTREFLGAEFTFRVIGSSHYVSAPTYDFYELSSCEAVDVDGATTIRLDAPQTTDATGSAGRERATDAAAGPTDATADATDATARTTGDADAVHTDGVATRRLVYETDALRCETVVERRPLAAFPGAGAADLAHEFEADAVTTVDVGTDAYETYHTYPEFDLALFTRTVFAAVPPDATPVEGVDAPATD